MSNNLKFIDWGLSDYAEALKKQKDLWLKRVNDEILDTLILTEHSPVFTIGKHGKIENLLVSEVRLKSRNINLYHIERGGDITFHGPGQIIGYPIFKIESSILGVRQFIYTIEQILCHTLEQFSINAVTKHPFIGVWIDDKKIASIGITVKKHVSFHGFALNVSTDLSFFDYINPCGLKEIEMTSMNKILQKTVIINLVKNKIKKGFLKVFCF